MAVNPIVILGGGISGLSCAYYLHKLCSPLSLFPKIIIIESNKHMGGWLKTFTHEDGVIHELGPRSLRSATEAGYNCLYLVEKIGLSDEVIGVDNTCAASYKRMILVNNKLHQLPSSGRDLIRSPPPFTQRLYKYILKDMRTPKVNLNEWANDISVYDFVNYRMGSEMADYFFDPLCRGITAGDSKKLSLSSVFPQMFKAEQKTGSLVKGILMNTSQSNVTKYYKSDLVMWAKNHKWSVYSFKDGIQTLPNRLCDYMLGLDGNPVEIYNESNVNKLEFNETTNTALISISTKEEEKVTIEADYVFSSLPAQKLSSILPKTQYSELCDALNGIKSVHMATVNLQFKGKVIPDDSGFGFLVPSREDSKILGIIYDSCVFPYFNAGQDITRLSVMIGGEWFEEVVGDVDNVDEDKVLNYALEATRIYLNINDDPMRYMVTINKNCIPQYYLGHRKRLETIDEQIKKHNLNISLIGASFQGFSVPDCIFNSKLAANRYAKSLGV